MLSNNNEEPNLIHNQEITYLISSEIIILKYIFITFYCFFYIICCYLPYFTIINFHFEYFIPFPDERSYTRKESFFMHKEHPNETLTLEPSNFLFSPSFYPSFLPTTSVPSLCPTTIKPSFLPTPDEPSFKPTTIEPSFFPTTNKPSFKPTLDPTPIPSSIPTIHENKIESILPTNDQVLFLCRSFSLLVLTEL